MSDRRGEIARGLAQTRRRIEDACAEAGRSADEVTLVVITKTFPASDVRHLHALGVRDVGENRHPEAGDKAAACADLDLRWHFVGQLQSNKARAVARYARVVHSVDRSRLARALAAATDPSRPLDCLVQVSLDPPDQAAGRGGVPVDAAVDLARLVAEEPSLRLRGVMAVAPPEDDPDLAFARLASLSAQVQQRWADATWVSAGMSGDLEAAIRHGATHVRVGSAILGTRTSQR
jgi:pyridoxal phosphate enzyme (YggS family)